MIQVKKWMYTPSPRAMVHLLYKFLVSICFIFKNTFVSFVLPFENLACPRYARLGWKDRLLIVQFLSLVWLCDPVDRSTPGFPVLRPSPGVCSDSRASSQWGHPTISSSVVPFSSRLHLSQHQGLFQWNYLLPMIDVFVSSIKVGHQNPSQFTENKKDLVHSIIYEGKACCELKKLSLYEFEQKSFGHLIC